MDRTDIANLRQNYTRTGLTEADADPDPLRFFHRWFDEALAAGVTEPNAMTLATVDGEGQPAARIVLLKGLDERGFVFYTNYESRKGRELAARPRAALVFWWQELERQVRIEGVAERVTAAESDAYFASRPRGSRLGAWASDQSRPIAERSVLEDKLGDVGRAYAEEPVPRPPHWGGYRVVPTLLEFWQGRANRLHDRLEYTLSPEGWAMRRLAP